MIECVSCYSTGYVFVKPDDLSVTLMRCRCEYGKAVACEFNYIPQYTREIGQVYVQQTFPSNNFIPQDISQMWNVAENWTAKKKFANDYWKYQIEKAKTN